MTARPNDAINTLVDYGKAADDLVSWLNELETTGAEVVRRVDRVTRMAAVGPESAAARVAMVDLLEYADHARAVFNGGRSSTEVTDDGRGTEPGSGAPAARAEQPGQ